MEDRYKSKIVVDLLLERINEKTDKQEILLLLRQNTGFSDGMYDLPGGHLEANEDLFDSMIREAKEEIGIDIVREDMKIIHIYNHYKKDMLTFVFSVNNYSNEIKNGEPNKCKELRWFEINKLPENTIPKIKEKILNLNKGIYYTRD